VFGACASKKFSVLKIFDLSSSLSLLLAFDENENNIGAPFEAGIFHVGELFHKDGGVRGRKRFSVC
jgi:hypothetical protein